MYGLTPTFEEYAERMKQLKNRYEGVRFMTDHQREEQRRRRYNATLWLEAFENRYPDLKGVYAARYGKAVEERSKEQ